MTWFIAFLHILLLQRVSIRSPAIISRLSKYVVGGKKPKPWTLQEISAEDSAITRLMVHITLLAALVAFD
jgi:hypothetical protein